jgi:hypothetical protein
MFHGLVSIITNTFMMQMLNFGIFESKTNPWMVASVDAPA